MIIERTYKIDLKYLENEICNIITSKPTDKISYKYIDKLGNEDIIEIVIKLEDAPMLLGNNVKKFYDKKVNSTAKIVFNSNEKFNNFIVPNWLIEFEYIE